MSETRFTRDHFILGHAYTNYALPAFPRRDRTFKTTYIVRQIENTCRKTAMETGYIAIHVKRAAFRRNTGCSLTVRHQLVRNHSCVLKHLNTTRCLKLSPETIMFSFCNVSGLFILTSGSRTLNDTNLQAPANWQGDNTDRASYIFYDAVISCSENVHLQANLRIPSSYADSILPDGTAAFVAGEVFVRTGETKSLIDAKHLKAFNTEASSLLPASAPFFTTHISSLGTICGEAQALRDNSIIFPVAVSVIFNNERKSFKLA